MLHWIDIDWILIGLCLQCSQPPTPSPYHCIDSGLVRDKVNPNAFQCFQLSREYRETSLLSLPVMLQCLTVSFHCRNTYIKTYCYLYLFKNNERDDNMSTYVMFLFVVTLNHWPLKGTAYSYFVSILALVVAVIFKLNTKGTFKFCFV